MSPTPEQIRQAKANALIIVLLWAVAFLALLASVLGDCHGNGKTIERSRVVAK